MSKHLQLWRGTVLMMIFLICQFFLIKNARADEIPEIIKIASQEHTALIKSATGQPRVIHQGDLFSPYGKVAAISDNRIVLTNRKAETVILQLKNNKTHVQRIQKLNTSVSTPIMQVTSNSGLKSNMKGQSSSAAGFREPENIESQ